jgi:hypothetical protein
MATNIDRPNYDTRTITDFKNKLIGGGTRANLFEVELLFPTGLKIPNAGIVGELYRFMVKGAELPGSTVSAISVPFRGRQLKVSGDRTFAPWTITVINDTNFTIRNSFEKWMNFMNRNDDNAGVITPAGYQTDLKVHQLGRGTANPALDQSIPGTTTKIPIHKSYKFYGAFPTDITPIALSYDSVDTIEEFSVTFEYQWWDTYEADSDVSMLGTGETT